MAGVAVVMPARLAETGDSWIPRVRGIPVSQCCFDAAVVIRFSAGGQAWEVRIEQPFVLIEPNGTEYSVVPGGNPAMLVPIVRMVGQAAEEATAFKDGRLELRFADGTLIRVPPDEGFEAWELNGPGGIRLVSLPGGELAVWASHPTDDGQP
ncbi:MAG: DUF6188 family protein [Acidimicrobiia bacterium]